MNAVDPLITVVKNWLRLYDNAPKGAGTSTTMLCEPALSVLGRPCMTVDTKLMDLAHSVARVVTQVDAVASGARVTAMRAALEAATGTTSNVVDPSMSLLDAARAYLKAYDDSVDSIEVSRTQLRQSARPVPRPTEAALCYAANHVVNFDVGSRVAFDKIVERLRDELKAVEVQMMRGSDVARGCPSDAVAQRARKLFHASLNVPGTVTPLGMSCRAIDATVKAILEHLDQVDDAILAAVPAVEVPKVGDQVRFLPGFGRGCGGEHRVWTVDRVNAGSARLCIGAEAVGVSCADLKVVPQTLDTEAQVEAKLLRDFGIRSAPSSVLAALTRLAHIVETVRVGSIHALSNAECITLGHFRALTKETP